MRKILTVAVLATFAFGSYLTAASSAIAAQSAEIEYVNAHAQVFEASDSTASQGSAVREPITVTMLDAVRPPVDNAIVSSGYGWRTPACRGCSSDHNGIDYTPGRGAPIYAIANGTVIDSGWMGGYGYGVLIAHVINGQNVQSLYAHMQAASIYGVGDSVSMGDVIGNVGSTGISTGAHLHFEIRIDGIVINPGPWLNNNVNYTDWDHLL